MGLPIVTRTRRNRSRASDVHAAMSRTLPVLAALLIVLAACGTSGGTPPPGSADPDPSPSPGSSGGTDDGEGIEHPTGADEAILIVDSAGGFVPVEFMVSRLPQFVLLGDGRVILQGMQTLEFPGPALPALIERTLTEEGIQEVLRGVADTNLFTADAEFRGAMNVVADAPDTVFILDAGGFDVTVTIYALGFLTPDMGELPGVTPGELEAHRVLQQLNDALLGIDAIVDGDGWEEEGWQPYEPEAFRLYVTDVTGQPIEGGDLPEQVREWPTDDDPAAFGELQANFGNGTRCGVVDGELGALWLEELGAANQMTLWTDDGDRRFRVAARPILPHEEPICPELFGA
jgi:hypothetical protein